MADSAHLDTEQMLAHATWVRPLARRLVFGDEALAEDVLQEAWMRALQNPPKSQQALGSWLRTTVRNVAHHVRRSHSARSQRERQVAKPEGTEPGPDPVERVELHQRLVSAVLELAEPYRSTLILRYYDDLSIGEIARRQDTREGTVRVRIKRAQDQLRRRFERDAESRNEWCVGLLPIIGLPLPQTAGVLEASAHSAAASAGSWIPTLAGGLALSGKKITLSVAVALVLSVVGIYVVVTTTSRPEIDRAKRAVESGDRRETGVLTQSEATSESTKAAEVPVVAAVQPAVVVGSVVFDDSGSPVADVGVKLTVRTGADVSSTTVRTGVEGEFRYESTVPFDLDVIDVDFGPRSLRLTEHSGLSLSLGQTRELTLEVSRGGRLEGVVVDEAGNPVVDAEVEAWCYTLSFLDYSPPFPPQRSTSTNEEGRFVVEALGPDFVAVASAPGRIATRRLNGYVRTGESLTGVRLTLAPATTMKGQVVDGSGRPVPRAVVAIEPIAGSAGQEPTRVSGVFLGATRSLSTETDAGGRFEFAATAPLDHALRVSHDRYMDWIERVDPSRHVRVVLDSGAMLSGQITDRDGRPINNARLRWADTDWSHGRRDRTTVTDADGEYRLIGLHPTTTGALFVHADSHALHVEQPVTLTREDLQLSLRLDPAEQISGTVIDGDGQPLAAVEVVIEGDRAIDHGDMQIRPLPTWERSWGLHRTQTDAEGRFTFDSLYAGQFRVRAYHRTNDSIHAERLVPSGTKGVMIELDPETLQRVVLFGTARDALTGEPIAKFTVTPMIPAESGALFGRGTTFDDPDGRFEIKGLEVGTMAVSVSAHGYSPWNLELEEYVAGDHRIDVELSPARSIELRILTEEGAPFSPGRVTFFTRNGRSIGVETGPGARFTALELAADAPVIASGLPAEEIAIRVSYPTGVLAGEFTIDLTEQPTETVELVLGAPTQHELKLFICGSDVARTLDVQSLGREDALRKLQTWIQEGTVWPIDQQAQAARNGAASVVHGTLTPLEGGGFSYHSSGFKSETPQPVLPVILSEDETALSISAEGYANSVLELPTWRDLLAQELMVVILRRNPR